jgi:hypothetical protein
MKDCPYHVVAENDDSIIDKILGVYTSTKHYCQVSTGNCVASKEETFGHGTFNKKLMARCPLYQFYNAMIENTNIKNPSLDQVLERIKKYAWTESQRKKLKGK